MYTAVRTLPYTKHLVFIALFDILEQENSQYRKVSENDSVLADISVYGNISGFHIHIRERTPATEMVVSVVKPFRGLSAKGQQRAADYIADRVEQILENELILRSYLHVNTENKQQIF